MQGKIYILQDQSKLSPMAETQWDAEHKLQQLIAEYPDLLGGDQIDVENHRRWLLVTREMPMQGEEPNTTRLSLDHLFLDQDGIPTLVEVKRGSNAQVRREVVGQLLDYAAIATSSLNVRDIQAALSNNGAPADSRLEKFLGEDANLEEFWQRVQSNLDRGQLRLIVLADSIPAELRRVVEFLNRQMNPAEFLAVEVKQFEYEGQKVLVPRVLGVTEAIRQKKSPVATIGKQWDEPMFMAAIEENAGVEVRTLAEQLLRWITPQVTNIFWGQGQKNSCFIPTIRKGKVDYQVCRVNSDGVFVFPFDWLNKKTPFDDGTVLSELLSKINAIPGIRNRFGEEKLAGRARFPLEDILEIQSVEALKSVLTFIVESVNLDPNMVSKA
ncbi:MAG: hypothetical protein K9M08_06050 [Pirellula sp.]|nr:hypothetical protein [Pirellula sp.]